MPDYTVLDEVLDSLNRNKGEWSRPFKAAHIGDTVAIVGRRMVRIGVVPQGRPTRFEFKVDYNAYTVRFRVIDDNA